MVDLRVLIYWELGYFKVIEMGSLKEVRGEGGGS